MIVAVGARHGAERCAVYVCMRQECGARRRVFMVEGTWTAIGLLQST